MNDYLSPGQMVGTASALITVNGFGAIFGPPIIAALQIYSAIICFCDAICSSYWTGPVCSCPHVYARGCAAEAQVLFIAVPDQHSYSGKPKPRNSLERTQSRTGRNEDLLTDNPISGYAKPAKPSK